MKLFKMKKQEKQRKINDFTIFISCSLVVAFCLAGFSLWLYGDSGAAQLDLSRPSYQEARKKAQEEKEKEKAEEKDKEFSASGDVDKKTIDEFEKIYNEKLKKLNGEMFRDDVLSDDNLNIGDNH